MLLVEPAQVNTLTASFQATMELANAIRLPALVAANVLQAPALTAHQANAELVVAALSKNRTVQEIVLMIIPAVLGNVMSQLVPKLAVITMIFAQVVIATVQLLPAAQVMPLTGGAAIAELALPLMDIAAYAPQQAKNATPTIIALIA